MARLTVKKRSTKRRAVSRKTRLVRKRLVQAPTVKKDYLFVAYSTKTAPSGRRLAVTLGSFLRSNGVRKPIHFGTAKTLVKRIAASGPPQYIANIGNVNFEGVSPASLSKTVILNPPQKIRESSNKRGCRIRFQENKVPSPELWLNSADIPEDKFPVVGRTTTHFKGKGFWLCSSPAEANLASRQGATHFLRLIKNTREFRVHLFSREPVPTSDPADYISIKLSEKLPREGEAAPKGVIKNHDSGWVFRAPDDNKSKREVSLARQAARFAMASAKLHWGAVDVMVSDETPYVLEINSSPSLTDATADTHLKYAEWITHQLGLVERVLPEKPTIKPIEEAFKKKAKKILVKSAPSRKPSPPANKKPSSMTSLITSKEKALLKNLLSRKWETR